MADSGSYKYCRNCQNLMINEEHGEGFCLIHNKIVFGNDSCDLFIQNEWG